MALGYAHFFVKDLRRSSLPRCVNRAARYISSTVIEMTHLTWVNIINYFPVVYTDCKRPLYSRSHSSRVQAIGRYIEELDLDGAKNLGIDNHSRRKTQR